MFGYSPLVILTVAAQIYFGIHAVRTGRTWWLFIILFFPGLGCLIYFLAEYLPEVRAGRRAKVVADRVASTVVHTLDPGKRIRELEARLRMTPSFANRHNLAEAYLEAGRLDEAIALFEQNTQGVHAQDPATMRGLAKAWHARGDMLRAREYIEKWRQRRESSLSSEMDLLYAQVLESLGQFPEALEEYRQTARRGGSFEAGYRAGMLLKSMGRAEEARAHFASLMNEAQLLGSAHRREQRHWIDLIQKELK